MQKLEQKITSNLERIEKDLQDNLQIKKFEKSSKEFEELVKKGVINKRGYNLLSATDAHIKPPVWFNTK